MSELWAKRKESARPDVENIDKTNQRCTFKLTMVKLKTNKLMNKAYLTPYY